MDISGLRRHLPTQGTQTGKEKASKLLYGSQLKGALKDSAVEQLATVPEPWLDRLAEENLAYVALAQNEDLSQTDLITSYSPERLLSDAKKARAIIAEVNQQVGQEISEMLAKETDEFARVMTERGKATLLKERLGERFGEAGIGFDIREVRGEKPLLMVEGEHNVEESGYEEFVEPLESEQGLFRELLVQLNGPEVAKFPGNSESHLALADDAVLDPENDVLIIPYGIYRGKRLSEVSKVSYASINGIGMDQHLGAHYWPNRLIVMDDDVVNLPSQKTGYHSVILHETGHAIDKIAEEYPELKHVETVEALYARDVESFKKGEKPFLTARAMDNVEEYFAEAVEAYLTKPVEGDDTWYKRENDCEQLKQRNPELYAHVDKVLNFKPTAEGSQG